jgi:hypothetical protein
VNVVHAPGGEGEILFAGLPAKRLYQNTRCLAEGGQAPKNTSKAGCESNGREITTQSETEFPVFQPDKILFEILERGP